MTGERPRRRWRIEVNVEGDSWEDAGRAFASALALLQNGKPEEVLPDRPFRTSMEMKGAGLRLEVAQDPRVTPAAYVEARAAWDKARSEEP